MYSARLYASNFPKNVWYEVKEIFKEYRCYFFSLQGNFACIVNEQEKGELSEKIRTKLKAFDYKCAMETRIKFLQGANPVMTHYRTSKCIINRFESKYIYPTNVVFEVVAPSIYDQI